MQNPHHFNSNNEFDILNWAWHVQSETPPYGPLIDCGSPGIGSKSMQFIGPWSR